MTTLRTVFISSLSVLLMHSLSAFAENSAKPLPPPPYAVHVSDYLIVGVQWNEAEVKKLLPSHIRPAKDMSGGIAIYRSDRGFGISPYQAVYTFVDVEGYDSTAGTKARWILQAGYGPSEEIAHAIRSAYGWPAHAATVSVESSTNANVQRARAQVGTAEVASLEIRLGTQGCTNAAGVNNYLYASSERISVNEVPFEGEWCPAEPVQVRMNASAAHPFGALTPAKLLWAGGFKGSIALSHPLQR